MLADASARQKIRKHITFHCFRHTFAMQLLDKGVDIYTIAALLGHRQVSSTQNYAKMSSKKMIEAIVKMEKLRQFTTKITDSISNYN